MARRWARAHPATDRTIARRPILSAKQAMAIQPRSHSYVPDYPRYNPGIIPSPLRNGTLKQPWVKRWKEGGEEKDGEAEMLDWAHGRGGGGQRGRVTKSLCNQRASNRPRRFLKPRLRLHQQSVPLENPHL